MFIFEWFFSLHVFWQFCILWAVFMVGLVFFGFLADRSNNHY